MIRSIYLMIRSIYLMIHSINLMFRSIYFIIPIRLDLTKMVSIWLD